MNDIVEQWKANYGKMEAKDDKARKEGKLVGRYVREQIADGYAYYEIVKENKNTVVLKQVTEMGDDYQVPYWGSGASIKKLYAINNVSGRDMFNKLFSKK